MNTHPPSSIPDRADHASRRHKHSGPPHGPARFAGLARGILGRWFLANSLLSGILALLWLLLRSGAKPSRFTYPCQRAAVGTATLAFGAPVVAAALTLRRRLGLWMRAPAVLAAAALGLILTVSLSIYFSRASEDTGSQGAVPLLRAPADYRAQIFHVSGCPQAPGGDHFVGFNNLLGVMGRQGLKFYKSSQVTPLSGPDGIIAAQDVVVIKINYQWDQRGGTNTDLLRGLIRTILDHPDGFSGEVVVCENAQFNSTSGFDRPYNNAYDHSLSPHDVVAAFQAQGYRVSHYDWTEKRAIQVGEYSTGDMNDGYVVEPYNGSWHGKLSYAKFRSASGAYISIRYGLWNPGGGTYDRPHLKFINVPVLKSHHATYGATVSTKHYMGVVTDQFSTNSHSGIHYGIMGALMGEIQTADLNIVDAIWINANPNSGPQTSYSGATERDELVASLDPIALDRWAVKNILIPGFLGNGYSPPWPTPSADPDTATSAFRQYLDNSMNQLLAAGKQVTNQYSQMDVWNGNGGAGDFDHNGTVDLADFERFAACYTGPGGGPVGPECAAGDFDGDGDVDCEDWAMFQTVWTASEPPPPFDPCGPSAAPQTGALERGAHLDSPTPNPAGGGTRISYSLASPGRVSLAVYDVNGRLVRALLDREEGRGGHAVVWDGRSDRGERAGPGVYWCRFATPGFRGAEKIVLE